MLFLLHFQWEKKLHFCDGWFNGNEIVEFNKKNKENQQQQQQAAATSKT